MLRPRVQEDRPHARLVWHALHPVEAERESGGQDREPMAPTIFCSTWNMIWHEIKDGEWSAGFYRIHRGINYYTLTFTHPKNFRILGQARSLPELKKDAETHARDHAQG